VLTRFRPQPLGSANISQFQSAYKKGHSIETALFEALDSVYTVANDKQVTVTVLIGLDMSAAFDTVNQGTSLERLQSEFGDTGTLLAWLQSHL